MTVLVLMLVLGGVWGRGGLGDGMMGVVYRFAVFVLVVLASVLVSMLLYVCVGVVLLAFGLVGMCDGCDGSGGMCCVFSVLP